MNSEICRIGFIVTGKAEERALPRLFRAIPARAHCNFSVIRRIGQRNPITKPKKLLRMVGTGRPLPSKDEAEIGIPVLLFLQRHPCSYALVVDDLERTRRPIADRVFARYRTALDEALAPSNRQSRAAVHFLVNMLEAYYFADAQAVNSVAGHTVLSADHPTDAEQIGNPKAELKQRWPAFDELDHALPILGKLDVEHVLARPEECGWLRAMFAWCVAKLREANAIWDQSLGDSFGLPDGCQSPITRGQ